MKNKRYRIEVSEDQLRMIINCVEDCHRFMGGQVELEHITSRLAHRATVQQKLREANIGKKHSEETKQKMRGRKLSEEHKLKISNSLKLSFCLILSLFFSNFLFCIFLLNLQPLAYISAP